MRQEQFAYSSVRGLLHQQKNIVNQDSYVVKRYKFGTVLVVSDGMGSHKHSDVGSQAACKAVCDAIQKWVQYNEKDIRLLIPIIHGYWNMEIFPYSKKECGATCLVAFVSNEGKLYVAQLGDGNIYISLNNQLELLQVKEDDFSNFTSGMSSIASFDEWTIKEYDISDKEVKLVLMTDGVSETLIENKKEAFVKLLWQKMGMLESSSTRNNMVYSLLNGWNSVNAGDDRTLVCYIKK